LPFRGNPLHHDHPLPVSFGRPQGGRNHESQRPPSPLAVSTVVFVFHDALGRVEGLATSKNVSMEPNV
jgi:hypothetical protein